jgi:hypothetical protein
MTIPFHPRIDREVVVKRRIWLIGAAISAIPLAFAVAAAAANGGGANVVKVTCRTATGIMIANGEAVVTPPVQQGTEYGTASCGRQFGDGVQADTFTVPPATGDTVAKFTLYFAAGTLHGTYDLTPQEGSFNFLETDWLGTLTVKSGTGTFQGMKGTGTMKCKTLDGIHTTCTDKLKLS